jgi:hypothetical protein
MVRHVSKLVFGATLFSSPEMNTHHEFPGLLGVVIALFVLVPPLVLYIRSSASEPPNSDGNDGGGGGTGPPSGPPDRPSGGIPLDEATPARIRLRGQGRLADRLPSPVRRPMHEPDRAPARETTPT